MLKIKLTEQWIESEMQIKNENDELILKFLILFSIFDICLIVKTGVKFKSRLKNKQFKKM